MISVGMPSAASRFVLAWPGPAAVGVVGAVALLTACAVPAPRQRSAAWAADGASG